MNCAVLNNSFISVIVIQGVEALKGIRLVAFAVLVVAGFIAVQVNAEADPRGSAESCGEW